MVLKRKIYEKLLNWKAENYGSKALLIEGRRYSTNSLKVFREKYKKRIGDCYVIHPKNLSLKDDIICIPPYMTMML